MQKEKKFVLSSGRLELLFNPVKKTLVSFLGAGVFCGFIVGSFLREEFMDENVDKYIFPCYTGGSKIYYSN